MIEKLLNWLYDGKRLVKKKKEKVDEVFDEFEDDMKDIFRIKGNYKTVYQKNNRTYVNGKLVSRREPAKIIVEGNVGELSCNEAEIKGNVLGSVNANTLECGDIGGDVESNTVKCKMIKGNVDANTVKGV